MSVDDLTIWNRAAIGAAFRDAKRIAIVGNGVVEADSTDCILASDVVVRFNNWATRTECRDHTLPNGTGRCDILVTHLDLHSGVMGIGDIGRPKLVVIGIPAPFQIDRIPAKVDQWYRYASVAMVNPYWNRQLCRALSLASDGYRHPLPTLGMTAIYHLARMQLSAEFYVCGFDWHFDPVADTIQGCPVTADRLPTHFNHWYVREAVWIARNLLPSDSWKFSQRATRTLDRVRHERFAWESEPHSATSPTASARK